MAFRYLIVVLASFLDSVFAQENYFGGSSTGAGYDILQGNPQNYLADAGGDPGIRSPVFNVSIFSGSNSPDNLYQVPEGVDVRDCNSCSVDFSFNVFFGASRYYSHQKSSVDVDLSGWNAAFSYNSASENIYEQTTKYGSVCMQTSSSCCVYTAQIDTFAPPPFTHGYSNAVKLMPTSFDSNDTALWDLIIATYGTHCITGPIDYGGKFGQYTEMYGYSYSSLSTSTMSVEEAAKYSAELASGGASHMTSSEIEMANQYSSLTYHQHLYNYGGEFPSDYQVTTWIQSCKKEPIPIKYKLTELPKLLHPLLFPDDANISLKQAAYTKAISSYCDRLKAQGLITSCDGLGPDPSAPKTSNFGGVYTSIDGGGGLPNPYTSFQSCPTGYTSYNVGRSYHPEKKIGQTTYMCLSALEDPQGSFGGMFQIADDHSENDSRRNPVTGDYSCPSGYDRLDIGRIYIHLGNQVFEGGSQYYCHTNANALGTTPFGGYYAISSSQGGINGQNNYYSNAQSCPSGYTAWIFGRQEGPECTCGVDQFICLNNVY